MLCVGFFLLFYQLIGRLARLWMFRFTTHQLGKALQPQIVAGALACIDHLCSAGFEERYTYKAGESASKPNTKLYM